jgi:hypothetical protein
MILAIPVDLPAPDLLRTRRTIVSRKREYGMIERGSMIADSLSGYVKSKSGQGYFGFTHSPQHLNVNN